VATPRQARLKAESKKEDEREKELKAQGFATSWLRLGRQSLKEELGN